MTFDVREADQNITSQPVLPTA